MSSFDIEISNINSSRFEIALELLSEGKSFTFKYTNFYLNKENKVLEIRKISEWRIQNLDEQIALEQINKCKEIYKGLLNNEKFAGIIKGYSLRFSLIQDFGNGSVEICYLLNNKIIWR